MAQVSVAPPVVEFDAAGVTLTQAPTEVDDSKLWGLRQDAVLAQVILLIVGEPPGPTGGGPADDGLDEASVEALIDARLATFSEVCD